MKNIMKKAFALVLGAAVMFVTVGNNVAYAAPGYSKHSHYPKYHAHIYNRAVTEEWTEATCESYATQTWACSQYVTKNGKKVLCEEKITVVSGPKAPHKYVSTATEKSEGVYQCECGAVKYEMCKGCKEHRIFGFIHVPHYVKVVAPKLQHTHVEVVDAAVESTCTETGLTAGSHCETCGEVLVAQQVVPTKEHDWYVTAEYVYCAMKGERHYKCSAKCGAYKCEEVAPTGHSWTEVEGKDPTCTEDGYYSYSVCDTCGFSAFNDSCVISKTGHEVVVDEAVAATCTSTGLTEGSHCATCGEVLVEQQVVPMEEHDWYVSAEYVYCTMVGERHFKCSAKCGAYKCEEVAPIGHSWTEVAEKAPTCTEDGHYEYSLCERCGYSTFNDSCVIEKTGHTIVDIPAVEATCTQAGLTMGSYCSTCGKVFIVQEETPMKEHDWHVLKDYSSCTSEGEVYYKCDVCKARKCEMEGGTGHSWLIVAKKEATSTEDGHEEYSLCEKCGYSTFNDSLVIEKTGHTD